MVQEFVFALIQITVRSEITFDEDLCHVETNQLIFIAMQLFGFYMARDIIEGNFRTFCGFLNLTFVWSFMFSIDRINVYGILFYLTCCLVTF